MTPRNHVFFITGNRNFAKTFEGLEADGDSEHEVKSKFLSDYSNSFDIRLSNYFEILKNDFNLYFLTSKFFENNADDNGELNLLAFYEVEQRQIINGINEFLITLPLQMPLDEVTGKSTDDYIVIAKNELNLTLANYEVFDENFDRKFFYEYDLSDVEDFYKFLLVVQYLFELAFNSNQILYYKTWR